jgi:hypothetical protein
VVEGEMNKEMVIVEDTVKAATVEDTEEVGMVEDVEDEKVYVQQISRFREM